MGQKQLPELPANGNQSIITLNLTRSGATSKYFSKERIIPLANPK